MIEFMLNIRFNNSKAFMEANRAEYQRRMRDPHYALIEALAPTMREIDPRMEIRPNKVLSRIFRDTRFSNDKSPYRDHHWLAFRRAGEARDKAVMFWFELRVEALRWGLGFWGDNRPAMDVLRRRMIARPEDLLALIPALDKRGLRIEGESYKRMEVPEDLHPELKAFYPLKDVYIVQSRDDIELAFGDQLLPTLIGDYRAMAPVYQLLRGCYDIAMLEGENSEQL